MALPRSPATRKVTASFGVLCKRRERLAKLCERYPETQAVNSYENEHRSLEVAGKRFGYFLYEHFGDDGRSGAVLKAPQGAQEVYVELDPDRFWVPAFVGRHGWLGIRLDLEEPDWQQVGSLVREAWMLTAPKRLQRQILPPDR